jgi:hypothetical protein
MKALTVCQPYASLIVGWDGIRYEDLKRVENRPRPYSHRGPLLIHAGLSTKWLSTWDGVLPPKMPFGALVGMVKVVACLSITSIRNLRQDLGWVKDHRHASGPCCLILGDARRFLEPIPYRGQVGLFEVPEAVIACNDLVDAVCRSAPLRETSEEVRSQELGVRRP